MSDPTDARAIAKAINWPYPNIYGQFVEDELVAVVEQIMAAAKAAPQTAPDAITYGNDIMGSAQAAPEPVAWRWRIKGGNNMDWTWSVDKPEGPSIHLFEVQPLYAAPPAVTEAAPTLSQPLHPPKMPEFRQAAPDEPTDFTALLKEMHIAAKDPMWADHVEMPKSVILRWAKTIAAAKAAPKTPYEKAPYVLQHMIGHNAAGNPTEGVYEVPAAPQAALAPVDIEAVKRIEKVMRPFLKTAAVFGISPSTEFQGRQMVPWELCHAIAQIPEFAAPPAVTEAAPEPPFKKAPLRAVWKQGWKAGHDAAFAASQAAPEPVLLTATVSPDAKVTSIYHDTDADWQAIRAAHISLRDWINERLEHQDLCPHKPAVTEAAPYEPTVADAMRALEVFNGFPAGGHWSPEKLSLMIAALKAARSAR